jgi:hypothetical protein
MGRAAHAVESKAVVCIEAAVSPRPHEFFCPPYAIPRARRTPQCLKPVSRHQEREHINLSLLPVLLLLLLLLTGARDKAC